jgi:hypothetical protein
MIFKRAVAKLRAHDWTAITIELAIVIMGVFIGIQVANWNQERLERRETRMLLMQIVPELESQIAFFDSVKVYFSTTRRYASQAFAGWENDPGVTDEQFVIAAHQASQIYGIGTNFENWALIFGGENLRNIEDPALRRNLARVMTNEYELVSFETVATPYRDHVRQVIPTDIQESINRQCGDRSPPGNLHINILSPRCELEMSPALAAKTADALRARPELRGELDHHLSMVAAYLANAELLAHPIRELHRQLVAEGENAAGDKSS